ncbi:hypothetical protein [Massilia aerilata]|uniref:Uncharacterized protein n=1 Tax=Massilia aerilata TaxID=453817 RepID=A0ABW0RXW7_9BURK
MLRYLGMAALVAVCFAVDYLFGPIGTKRLVGAFFLLFAAIGIGAPEVGFGFKGFEEWPLRGWKKAFVLVPAAAIGIVLLVYATEITCASHRYRHLCT